MLLTLSDKRFPGRIKSGIKIHSIREDKHDRWKVGMKIQFWMNSPRNPDKNPYQFAEGVVEDLIPIKIDPGKDTIIFETWGDFKRPGSLDEFARNDGFDNWEEMKEFFNNKSFEGKIIVWKQDSLKFIK